MLGLDLGHDRGAEFLAWMWATRPMYRRASATGSPPAKKAWPVSSRSFVAGPVFSMKWSISCGGSTTVPMWWW